MTAGGRGAGGGRPAGGAGGAGLSGNGAVGASGGTGSADARRAGRRALFSDGPEGSAIDAGTTEVAAGRRALFSSTEPLQPSRAPGTAVVHCRTCLAATPMSLPALGLALIPSLWLPTRPWPRLMRCPACHRVSWCRIDWPTLR